MQAPFVTLFMYIDEVPEGRIRDDLVMIIEEVLNQRYKGVKNEKGIWITPAFPKLIYVLDKDNIFEDSKYFWLTKLAAKCTAKRLVPDYISAKVMKGLKDGHVYTAMGCVEGNELVTYKINDKLYIESFEKMWNRVESLTNSKVQPLRTFDKYIELSDLENINVSIYDKMEGFVNIKRVIRNLSTHWVKIKTSNKSNKYNT